MLTKVGKKVGLTSLAMYGAALGLGYRDLAIPAAAGAVAVCAAALTVARRPHVQVSVRVTPASVSRGQQVTAVVTVRNDARSRSPRFALALPHGTDLTWLSVRGLAPGQHRQIAMTLRCDRRGPLEIGPPVIQQGDAFGLCSRIQIAGHPVAVVVYPMLYPLPLPLALRSRRLGGTASAEVPENGVIYHSLREYVPGDDLRHVHWLASARLASTSGSLLVRRLANLGDVRHSILLDTCSRSYHGNPDAAEGPFEAALDLAASVLTAYAKAGMRIDLHAVGGMKVKAGPGHASAQRVLDALARVQSCDEDPAGALAAAAGSLRTSGVRAAAITVITGGSLEIPHALTRTLRHSNDQVIIARIGGLIGERATRPAEQADTGHRLQIFQAATAAEAVTKWAARITPGGTRQW